MANPVRKLMCPACGQYVPASRYGIHQIMTCKGPQR